MKLQTSCFSLNPLVIHQIGKLNILNYVLFHTGPSTVSAGIKLNHMTASTNRMTCMYTPIFTHYLDFERVYQQLIYLN